jgi:site-specific DNA-methyltransferase (adenine-specific)
MTPYYEQDGITIYHGDCREILPRLSQVDHVITDPPYEAEAHTPARRQNGIGVVGEYAIGFKAIDQETRLMAGYEMARLGKKWILAFCQVEAAMLWRDVMCPPARYIRTQIWRKSNGSPQFTGDRPGMGYESIVTCWGDGKRSTWNGGGRHGVYEHFKENGGTGHQTEKPLSLLHELIVLFTNDGETILDPFMGSGTTLVAAKRLGRRAVGIEIEERYCEIAAKRLSQGALPLSIDLAPEQSSLIR